MEPILAPPPAEAAPATAAAPANAAAPATDATATDAADQYAPVAGRSLAEVEQVRQLESIAAQKTARDYQHVIWAYGILWALFAAYGVFLWRRGARLRADMNELRQELAASDRA